MTMMVYIPHSRQQPQVPAGKHGAYYFFCKFVALDACSTSSELTHGSGAAEHDAVLTCLLLLRLRLGGGRAPDETGWIPFDGRFD